MKKFPFIILSSVLVLLCSCSDVEIAALKDDILISNVTIVDAKQGLIEGVDVAITDGLIIRVSSSETPSSSSLEFNESAQVIDGKGKYLIPGLWDMHVHLTYDKRFTNTMPEAFLSWGITSVRDTGGMLQDLLPIIKRLREPGVFSPRVYFSGPLLDGEHVVYDGVSRPLIGTRNSDEEQARENVRILKASGADFIKIYEMVTPEVFKAIVNEAVKLSMPIASHVPLNMLASKVGDQVGTMEHLRNIELDCASNAEDLLHVRRTKLASKDIKSGYLLRASLHKLQRLTAVSELDEKRCAMVLSRLTHTIQVPTLRLNALSLAPPFEQIGWANALAATPLAVQNDWGRPNQTIPQKSNERDLRFSNYSLSMVKRMVGAGVPIGAGTDTPIGLAIPGFSLHRELEMLVLAGLTPLQAIEAATIRPTEFFGIEDQLGTIEEGKWADLVLLSANPLTDIRNTRQIDSVISKGILVQRF